MELEEKISGLNEEFSRETGRLERAENGLAKGGIRKNIIELTMQINHQNG